MMRKVWKGLQLLALVPVAVLSALAATMSFAGIGGAFSSWDARGLWHVGETLLFGAFLLIPLFAVFCLYFAIMQEPEAIRARPRLTLMVIVGLIAGSLLALILIPMELTGDNPQFGVWTLSILLPLALAILHIVRIARAKPARAPGPAMTAPPVE